MYIYIYKFEKKKICSYIFYYICKICSMHIGHLQNFQSSSAGQACPPGTRPKNGKIFEPKL